MPKSNFDNYHIEKLKNEKYARVYLEVALEEYETDGDSQSFFNALKDVAKAQGGLSHIAEKANLSRQNLYKALSGNKKPRLETISHFIHGLGYKFALQPIQNNRSSSE
jgi:probable addiction module antidote protein